MLHMLPHPSRPRCTRGPVACTHTTAHAGSCRHPHYCTRSQLPAPTLLHTQAAACTHTTAHAISCARAPTPQLHTQPAACTHPEHQRLVQVVGVAPHHPAQAGVHQAVPAGAQRAKLTWNGADTMQCNASQQRRRGGCGERCMEWCMASGPAHGRPPLPRMPPSCSAWRADPLPQVDTAHLCPLALMLATFFSRKSQARSGYCSGQAQTEHRTVGHRVEHAHSLLTLTQHTVPEQHGSSMAAQNS